MFTVWRGTVEALQSRKSRFQVWIFPLMSISNGISGNWKDGNYFFHCEAVNKLCRAAIKSLFFIIVKIRSIHQVCKMGKAENAVSKFFHLICSQWVWLCFSHSIAGFCLGTMELRQEFCPSFRPIMKGSFWEQWETQKVKCFV